MMNNEFQNQQPVYVVKQVSPENEAASTTAIILETIFGFFSLLGVGHVYTGRVGFGIALMIIWWSFIAIAGFVSTLTLGLAACLFGPIYIVVPILSGIQARSYMQKKGGTGSWASVAGVAGGGCLLVIIAVVLVVVFFGVLNTDWVSFGR